MVGHLVDEKAAAVGLVAVPAAEVVRAVHRVEHPLEGHGDDLADLATDELIEKKRAERLAQREAQG